MPPFMIVPAARPDLALTLVTENGAAALALLPRQPGSRMQLFDNVPADIAVAEPDASPHALLAKAGALSGLPTPPADARGQAQILDFAIALAISLVNPRSGCASSGKWRAMRSVTAALRGSSSTSRTRSTAFSSMRVWSRATSIC